MRVENRSFTWVVKDGRDSSVMISHLWVGFGTLLAGDIIRAIDGTDDRHWWRTRSRRSGAAAGGNHRPASRSRSIGSASDSCRTLRFDDGACRQRSTHPSHRERSTTRR